MTAWNGWLTSTARHQRINKVICDVYISAMMMVIAADDACINLRVIWLYLNWLCTLHGNYLILFSSSNSKCGNSRLNWMMRLNGNELLLKINKKWFKIKSKISQNWDCGS